MVQTIRPATARLSKQDWLNHGLAVLARKGHGALKADPLAKSLNVSRGSFYWHFKNLDDFHAAVLSLWRTRMTERVIAFVEAEAPLDAKGGGRLRLLMRRALSGDDGLERAVRSWAVQNAAVRQTVAEVDRVRIDYLTKLLRASGLAQDSSRLRAQFLYWANLGRLMVSDPALQMMTSEDIDDLADLLQH